MLFIYTSNLIVDMFHYLVRFVKGKKPGQGTGFDIDDADLLEMEQCHGIVVASAIFGTELNDYCSCLLLFSVPFVIATCHLSR